MIAKTTLIIIRKGGFYMKKRLLAAALVILALVLCACGSKAVPETYCDSLAAAEKLVGFQMEAPDALNGSGTKTFCAKGRTIEIMYFDGKVLNGRISKSDNGENVGGFDYGYTVRSVVSGGGVDYTLSGSEEGGDVHLATWTKGKYSYLVLDGAGKSAEEMVAFCSGIR